MSARALDAVATLRIEELIRTLKERYTIVTVTHDMQQAARAEDHGGVHCRAPWLIARIHDCVATAGNVRGWR